MTPGWSVGVVGLLLAGFLRTAAGQYGACDYTYTYTSGQTSFIQSPNFPNYYAPGTKCRYTVIAPTYHYLYVQCYDMYLPASTNCYYDKLSVSLTGDSTLADAQFRCGTTTFNVQTTYNRLVVALLGSTSTSGGRFKCQITAINNSCVCGRRKTPTIVGGFPTQVNEYPMMSGLVDSGSKQVFCGSTIVTDQYVVTAAHCLLQRQVSTTGVLVGDQNTNVANDSPYTQLLLVSTFIPNPGYDANTKVNDIALVRTAKQIVFNAGVGRVCLPFRYSSSLFTGSRLNALGWGTTDFGSPLSPNLLQTTLTVIPQSDCATRLNRTIPATQLCTFTPGNDTCQSDSGGPLYYTDPNSQQVYEVGVVGFGVGCAGRFPAVNTRVASYLDWIVSVTGYTFCER